MDCPIIRGRTVRIGNLVFSDRLLLDGAPPKIREKLRTPGQLRARAVPIDPRNVSESMNVGGNPTKKPSRARRPGPNLLGDQGKPQREVPVPRRISSLGNGLVLDWKVSTLDARNSPYYLTGSDPGDMATWVPRETKHRIGHIDALWVEGYSRRFSTLWMCDDDSAYASYAMMIDEDVAESNAWLLEGFRPLALVPMAIPTPPVSGLDDDGSPGPYNPEPIWAWDIEYVALAVADDWGKEGALVEAWKTLAKRPVDGLLDRLDEEGSFGWRPISIRAVSYPIQKKTDSGVLTIKVVPQFSIVLVRDNIAYDECKILFHLSLADFLQEQADAWAAGYRTISLTACNDAGELRFTAVVVLDSSGVDGGASPVGEWQFQTGLSDSEFVSENEKFRQKGWQLVAFTSHPDVQLSQGLEIPRLEDVRFSGVWRKYARRRLIIDPASFGVDDAAVAAFAELLPAEMIERQIGAAAVCVMRFGEMVFTQACTYAPEGMQIATTASPFRLGSVSKSITSLGVFSLFDDEFKVRMKDGSDRHLDLGLPVFRVKGMLDFSVSDPDMSEVNNWFTIEWLATQVSGWNGQYPGADPPLFGDKTADLSNGTSSRVVSRALGTEPPVSDAQMQQYITSPELWPDRTDTGASVGIRYSGEGLIQGAPFRFEYANMNFESLKWFISAAVGEGGYVKHVAKNVLSPIGIGRFSSAFNARVKARLGEPVYGAFRISYRNDDPSPIPEDEASNEDAVPSLDDEVKRNANGSHPTLAPWSGTRAYMLDDLERNLGSGGWLGTAEDTARLLTSLIWWDSAGMITTDGDTVISQDAIALMLGGSPYAFDIPGEESPWRPDSGYLNGWYVLPNGFGVQGNTSGSSAYGLFRNDGYVIVVVASKLIPQGIRVDFETAADSL